MTLGATARAFGDWIGLDGTFGLDGRFANGNEGIAAAGNGAGGAGGGKQSSSNDDDDRSDRVVIITGGVRGGNKVVTDGGLKDRTALEDRRPILLDLDGNGVQITELDRSTVFMEASGSGLKHRTAWAGAGDGVLFYDADGSGTINDDREYVFTAWDKTAGDDLAALRSRFDTNGDGRLSGAELNNFKVMKTNADGSLTAVTLASLGITQINLTQDATHIEMPDGSAITGQGSFDLQNNTFQLAKDQTVHRQTYEGSQS